LHKSCRYWQQTGLKIGKCTGTDSTPIKTHNDPDGKIQWYYKKEMIKAQISMDYEHNIPLAKKYAVVQKVMTSILKISPNDGSICQDEHGETWFDGGYNSNKNIAFAHVEMGLMSYYHIDKDWRENVKI